MRDPFIFLALKHVFLRPPQQKLRIAKIHPHYRQRLMHRHSHHTCLNCRRTILGVLSVFHSSTAFGSFLEASVDVPSIFTKRPSFQSLSLSLSGCFNLIFWGGSSSKRSTVHALTYSNKFITAYTNDIYFFYTLLFVFFNC